MERNLQIFQIHQRKGRLLTWGDITALIIILLFLYVGVRLAFNAPEIISGPSISLNPATLPWYTTLSVGRMLAAYLLSVIFTLIYGRAAAYDRRAKRFLMPLLDVLQSVPILSFLPVVLLSLSALLPQTVAAELASIVLIFTSQAWNLTFSWYQSLTTIPKELCEASAIFRLNTWMKFRSLELPFGMISLVWNSMMSWAGGWFFLMAAEIFTVGSRDFRLPGLGAYLFEAANQNNHIAIAWGLGVLIFTVVVIDQLIWKPLIVWSERFKVEMVDSDISPSSWFYDLIGNANFLLIIKKRIIDPLIEKIDRFAAIHFPFVSQTEEIKKTQKWQRQALIGLFLIIVFYGLYRAGIMLITVPLEQWKQIVESIFLH